MQQSRAITYITGKFIAREQHGIKKYGVTVDRSDLQPEQWLVHLEEELMDGLLYLQRSKVTTTAYRESFQELRKQIQKLIDLPINRRPSSSAEWEDRLAKILRKIDADMTLKLLR